MKSYDLGFISDEDIFNHVSDTVSKYRTSIKLADFNKNIIDPIKLTFDSKVYKKNFDQVVADECLRQIDKSNTNHIGYFHQNIFKYAGNGWVVPPNGENGFDVYNEDLHIYCELKNKHNTMNSSSAQKTYMKMQQRILEDSKATCYLVEAIAVTSQDINWVITVDDKTYNHDMIRRISLDKFYNLVFGDEKAFARLCKKLPDILDDVISSKNITLSNSVNEELHELNENTFKSLFLLAFNSYSGFSNF